MDRPPRTLIWINNCAENAAMQGLYEFRHRCRLLTQGEAEMKIDGACHCGFITYEADADPEMTGICHCTDCQTLSGSAFRSVVPSRQGSFKLRSGEPKIYVKTAESGIKRQQAFCPNCGTPIYSTTIDDGPKVHSIRVGTLHQRNKFVPKLQYWFRSSQPWTSDLGAIPRTERQR